MLKIEKWEKIKELRRTVLAEELLNGTNMVYFMSAF